MAGWREVNPIVSLGGAIMGFDAYFSFMWKRLKFVTRAKLTTGIAVAIFANLGGMYLNYQVDWSARIAWGEARGEPKGGMHAVLNVMANRRADPKFPTTLSGVAKQQYQFTAFNIDDVNRAKLEAVDETDPQFKRARRLAMLVQLGLLPDITNGATYFHSDKIERPVYLKDAEVSTRIGAHIFYVEVE